MVLTYRKIPDDVGRVMAAGVENMMKSRTFDSTHLARALAKAPRAAQINLVTTLPVYNLGLSDIAAGLGLSSAIQTGWRSLVGADSGVYAISDVQTNATSGPVFAQVNTGPFVKGLDQALKVAHADTQLGANKYEVRVLVVPALYVTALWLVGSAGKSMILPVEPCPPYLKGNAVVPEAEFVSTILPVARELQAANEKLAGRENHS